MATVESRFDAQLIRMIPSCFSGLLQAEKKYVNKRGKGRSIKTPNIQIDYCIIKIHRYIV